MLYLKQSARTTAEVVVLFDKIPGRTSEYELFMSLRRHSYNHLDGKGPKEENSVLPRRIDNQQIDALMLKLAQQAVPRLLRDEMAVRGEYVIDGVSFRIDRIDGSMRKRIHCYPLKGIHVVGIESEPVFAALTLYALMDLQYHGDDIFAFHQKCYNDTSFKHQNLKEYERIRNARTELRQVWDGNKDSIRKQFEEASGNALRVGQFFRLAEDSYN